MIRINLDVELAKRKMKSFPTRRSSDWNVLRLRMLISLFLKQERLKLFG